MVELELRCRPRMSRSWFSASLRAGVGGEGGRLSQGVDGGWRSVMLLRGRRLDGEAAGVGR